MAQYKVSIHAPTGGATRSPRRTRRRRSFQFTRPRGARPQSTILPPTTRGFNSRAHGGRDLRTISEILARRVSIHAPTGGATLRAGWVRTSTAYVSIHAPTGGATL